MKKTFYFVVSLFIVAALLGGCNQTQTNDTISEVSFVSSKIEEKKEETYSDQIFLIDKDGKANEKNEYVISFKVSGEENPYSCYVKIPNGMELKDLGKKELSIGHSFNTSRIETIASKKICETEYKSVFEDEKIVSYLCPEYIMGTDALISIIKPFALGEEKEVIGITTFLIETKKETEELWSSLNIEGIEMEKPAVDNMIKAHQQISQNVNIKKERAISTISEMKGIQFGDRKIENISSFYGYGKDSVGFQLEEKEDSPLTKIDYHISLITEKSVQSGSFIGLKDCEEIKDEQGNIIAYYKKENKRNQFYLKNGRGYWSISLDGEERKITLEELSQVIEQTK